MIALFHSARSSSITHQILITCNRSHLTTTLRQFYGFNNFRPVIHRGGIRNVLNSQPLALGKNVSPGLLKMYSSQIVQTTVTSSRSKLKQIDKQYIKRLLSLAKPERWKLAGQYTQTHLSYACNVLFVEIHCCEYCLKLLVFFSL